MITFYAVAPVHADGSHDSDHDRTRSLALAEAYAALIVRGGKFAAAVVIACYCDEDSAEDMAEFYCREIVSAIGSEEALRLHGSADVKRIVCDILN